MLASIVFAKNLNGSEKTIILFLAFLPFIYYIYVLTYMYDVYYDSGSDKIILSNPVFKKRMEINRTDVTSIQKDRPKSAKVYWLRFSYASREEKIMFNLSLMRNINLEAIFSHLEIPD